MPADDELPLVLSFKKVAGEEHERLEAFYLRDFQGVNVLNGYQNNDFKNLIARSMVVL